MQNLAAICEAAGATLADVVKTTVFLQEMSDFQGMNEVYARHFGDNRPARSTVAVRGLPRDVRVEIEAIVRLPSA
jgi:2-iminobutanoate/2-iminopropanoate deaminase